MARKENITAFVLRAVNYADRDVIVTLLSRDRGVISAIAKNARSSKRFSGGIQPFRKVDALIESRSNKDIHLFLEMQVLAHYPKLEADYDKITIGSYGTELLRELSKGEPSSDLLFDLLESFYQQLDAVGDDALANETILHHFELLLLKRFGALPSLHGCHRCGKPHEQMEKLQCKRTGEGLLCESCRRPGEAVGVIEAGTLATLQYYLEPQGGFPRALGQAESRQQARRVVNNSFKIILQKDLKSRGMLETVLV